MLYMDYTWDLSSTRIILDEELDIDKLGWQSGDLFRVTNVNGRAMLVKVEPLENLMVEGGHWLRKETNEQV